jgi:hypothetical protein
MQRFCELRNCDSLGLWLRHQIFPQLGFSEVNGGSLDACRLRASNRVYLFSAVKDGFPVRVVGKFYGENSDSLRHRKKLLMQEYRNIQLLRKLGFDAGQHQVIRCLGYDEFNDCVLVTNYVEGYQLDFFIKEAIFRNETRPLYDALVDLAYFLWLLHFKTRRAEGKVEFHKECAYAHKTLERLRSQDPTLYGDVEVLSKMIESWKCKAEMWSVPSVQIHGDCTPTNFVFSDNPRLVALDLERSRRGDPAFDTGMVAGELIHHFIMFKGDAKEAEPFIHHLYKQYCFHSSSPDELFREITGRNPFYQAITELRIAKNNWISPEHRLKLVDEARKCLQYSE